MKKLIALLVALMMTLCCFSALAEDAAEDTEDEAVEEVAEEGEEEVAEEGEEAAPEAITVELVENGAWIPFADYNFQICLPGDWNVLELTEEQTQNNVIGGYASADGARSCWISYTEMAEATDIETVAEQLSASYEGVQLITINDIPFITYTLADKDMVGLCTLGGSGVGFYQFLFTPASDAEYLPMAESIAASISAIEE